MKKKNMFSRLLQVCQTEKSIIKKRTAGRKKRTFAEKKNIFKACIEAYIPNISPLIIPWFLKV